MGGHVFVWVSVGYICTSVCSCVRENVYGCVYVCVCVFVDVCVFLYRHV